MILDATGLTLQAVLAGAIATNQPECHVDYVVWTNDGQTSKPGLTRTALNSTTDVTILAAPPRQGYVHEVREVSIYNKDTAAVTVTVKTDDGTERIIIKATLATLESLCYSQQAGWYAMTAAGARK